jgi:hypothetical protein
VSEIEDGITSTNLEFVGFLAIAFVLSALVVGAFKGIWWTWDRFDRVRFEHRVRRLARMSLGEGEMPAMLAASRAGSDGRW